MPKVTYIEYSGETHAVEASLGQSVMEAALRNNVPGIDADCGGACACATCHVYVDPDWLHRLGPRNAMEHSMLEFAEGVEDNSRLACQLPVSDELDGLIVRLPASQH